MSLNKTMKNLKYVIAIRHGHYDSFTESLTPYGASSVSKKAVYIRSLLDGSNEHTQIITSTIKRAVETADILASSLGINDVSETEHLATESYEDGIKAAGQILDLVKEETKALIVVTHFQVPSGIVDYFMMNGTSNIVGEEVSDKACGYITDLSNHTYKYI